MSMKVNTGFRSVAHQMHPSTAMTDAVKSGIEQLQRRRYLAAYASILVSMLDGMVTNRITQAGIRCSSTGLSRDAK